MAAPSPAPSSPGLEGYDSALEEVATPLRGRGDDDSDAGDSSGDESNRTIVDPPPGVSLIGVNPGVARERTYSLPPRDWRGRYARRTSLQSTASDATDGSGGSQQSKGLVEKEIGSAKDLLGSRQSLAWEEFQEQEARPHSKSVVLDFSNSSTHAGPNDSLREGELEQILDDIQNLTPVDERGESRASNGNVAMEGNGDQPPGDQPPSAAAQQLLEEMEFAIEEIKDDFLPFLDTELTLDRVNCMLDRATELKRIIRENGMRLTRAQAVEYTVELRTANAAARLEVTNVVKHLLGIVSELAKARDRKEEEAMRVSANTSSSSMESAVDPVLVTHTVKRNSDWDKEYDVLVMKMQTYGEAIPVDEERLYAAGEKLKILSLEATALKERGVDIAAALHKCHDYSTEACLQERVSTLQATYTSLQGLMVDWRASMGVFAEKSGRSVNRANLKAPKFTGAAKTLTIYEFRKDFAEYKLGAALTKQEAVAELKAAIQTPQRRAILEMKSEEEIITYLMKQFGNPKLLLVQRLDEARSWSNCSGTDQFVRDWMSNAKSRVESTVELCERHNILVDLLIMPYFDVIQSKLSPKLNEKLKKRLRVDCDETGYSDPNKKIPTLLSFLTEMYAIYNKDVCMSAGSSFKESTGPGAGTGTREDKQKGKNQRGVGAHVATHVGVDDGTIGDGGQPQTTALIADGGGRGGKGQRGGAGRGRGRGDGGRGGRGGNVGASSGTDGKAVGTASGKPFSPRKCEHCSGTHTYLMYCEEYIKAQVDERFDMVIKQKSCSRCLSMGWRQLGKKADWWPTHDLYCFSKFVCEKGGCSKAGKVNQRHITVCAKHASENATEHDEFVKSLDPSLLPGGITQANARFFILWGPQGYQAGWDVEETVDAEFKVDEQGYQLVPDVSGPAIYLMQTLAAERDPSQTLLCFYDSGCNQAGISDRAYGLLTCETVRKGPTVLGVAGGQVLQVPHGDERFYLKLADKTGGTKSKATVTGLRIPNVTSEFPLFELHQAWEELQTEALKSKKSLRIPKVDATIGGTGVDVILGIKYLKHYPDLLFSLPSGLSVYKAKLLSASGNQAVLGGPHTAWAQAHAMAQFMNPRLYLTSEARAWYVGQNWVEINSGKLSQLEMFSQEDPESDCSQVAMQKDLPGGGCDHCHCQEETGHATGLYSAAREEKEYWKVENLGTEATYRCISCRNCSKCRDSEDLEAVSFKEEAEQALIEDSVELDPTKNIVWAKLPFVEDPVVNLRPNRFIAEKVLQSQLELVRKNPSMREDTVKSHQKLVDKGHVCEESELPKEHLEVVRRTPGEGYFIPWRTVYNEGSISTPCRMVFDASAKTPGGNSLNGVLAKGQNRLCKLQHLLVRFRKGEAAVTADISMAYNGTKLRPEHLKYQKYLWKEGLLPENPTKVMYVTTLIYGVKPSGQQTQVSLEKLAAFHRDQGKHLSGAAVLERDTYVDDIINSQDSQQECMEVASEIVEILARGSMSVKAFTYSRNKPEEKVSADGVHVGLAGYLWAPEADTIELGIGPPRLGKAKRGRRPDPVTGDYKQALKLVFTKRVLTGLVAGVFDPLGLATPITAGFKLDLHRLCELKLDWDDKVPENLLDDWVSNMERIQELGGVTFQRSIIPEDAVSTKIELLVMTDASQNLGVVAIFGRVLRKNGLYSCQLLTGRSKLLSGMTIPKAELKAAVAGATTAAMVRRNLGDRYDGAVYVTDSTICLYWITQDDRPLQVGVRNAVTEIRRFSDTADWFHITTDKNVADLGTRPATVAEIKEGSSWQVGQPWMTLPRDKMPMQSAAAVTLTAEEKRLAATELRNKDVRGHDLNFQQAEVGSRYSLSKYLVDPCQRRWTGAVRIMALVLMFIKKLRHRVVASKQPLPVKGTVAKGQEPVVMKVSNWSRPSRIPAKKESDGISVNINGEEMAVAADYFFKKATKEVKRFTKPADYKTCSIEKNDILYFSGRLLDSGNVKAMEEVMFDLSPVSFCKPIVDRHSPVGYAIMLETHWGQTHHLNSVTTYRESLATAYIIKGRDLAKFIRETCSFCIRYKARTVQVEMGKIHENRLVIAPPFTYCQVDLLGPYTAFCRHNHRSTVKVWGVVFKDTASGAIFVLAMEKCDTESFIMAYTRFAARFCHPMKLFPDEGSQLLKACREMEISWIDVSKDLNTRFQVGVEFEACPVGGHNYHGQVERSIKEVKKLFDTVYRGVKLDVMGYETCFAWISNELNNLPLCLGSKYKDLENLDLLTPNRLIHGRANRRAMSGPCTVDNPSATLAKMEDIFQAWWNAWYSEKLADFVAKPPKWFRTGQSILVGDIVIFQKRPNEHKLGTSIWTIGRIVETTISKKDGLVREVVIEYINATERMYRTTHRAARSVAVLFQEGDLDLTQQLSEASREATRAHLMRPVAEASSLMDPDFLTSYALGMNCLKGFCQEASNPSSICSVLGIHKDPWDMEAVVIIEPVIVTVED